MLQWGSVGSLDGMRIWCMPHSCSPHAVSRARTSKECRVAALYRHIYPHLLLLRSILYGQHSAQRCPRKHPSPLRLFQEAARARPLMWHSSRSTLSRRACRLALNSCACQLASVAAFGVLYEELLSCIIRGAPVINAVRTITNRCLLMLHRHPDRRVIAVSSRTYVVELSSLCHFKTCVPSSP
jgi:hypothetical protein